MRQSRPKALLLFVSCWLTGCGGSSAPSTSRQDPIIYDNDDRLEYYQVSPAQQALTRSTVAIFDAKSLTPNGSGYDLDVSLSLSNTGGKNPDYDPNNPASGGKLLPFCPDERFYTEPRASYCSGFMIAPDLVMTAYHCKRDRPVKSMAFVFNYRMDSATSVPATAAAGDVYFGQSVFAFDQNEDYLIVRVSQPMVGHVGLQLSNAQASTTTPYLVVGHPIGLPVKFAGNAFIQSSSTTQYYFDSDTYAGNSGSPFIDEASGQVVAMLIAGGDDFVRDTTRNCLKSNHCVQGFCDNGAFGQTETAVKSTVVAPLQPTRELTCPTPNPGFDPTSKKPHSDVAQQQVAVAGALDSDWVYMRKGERHVAVMATGGGSGALSVQRYPGSGAAVASAPALTVIDRVVDHTDWYRLHATHNASQPATVKIRSDIMALSDANGDRVCGSADTCFGAIGSNCDLDLPLPSEGIPLPRSSCRVNGDATVSCATSVGSQAHDSCCSAAPLDQNGKHDGYWCNGLSSLGSLLCVSAWQHAVDDVVSGVNASGPRYWDVTYDPTSITYSPATLANPAGGQEYTPVPHVSYLGATHQALWIKDAVNGWCSDGRFVSHDDWAECGASCPDGQQADPTTHQCCYTCAGRHATCGTIDDTCGHALDCGACPAEQVCAGQGNGQNCVSDKLPCIPSTCADLGLSCGSADDGCGHQLTCGSCGPSPGGPLDPPGGPPPPPIVPPVVPPIVPPLPPVDCQPQTCASAGKSCGWLATCGFEVNCYPTSAAACGAYDYWSWDTCSCQACPAGAIADPTGAFNCACDWSKGNVQVPGTNTCQCDPARHFSGTPSHSQCGCEAGYMFDPTSNTCRPAQCYFWHGVASGIYQNRHGLAQCSFEAPATKPATCAAGPPDYTCSEYDFDAYPPFVLAGVYSSGYPAETVGPVAVKTQADLDALAQKWGKPDLGYGCTACLVPATDLATNGDFADGLAGWHTWCGGSGCAFTPTATATAAATTSRAAVATGASALRIENVALSGSGTSGAGAAYVQQDLSAAAVAGSQYQVTFEARAAANQAWFYFGVQQNSAPWGFAGGTTCQVSSDWTTCAYTTTVPSTLAGAPLMTSIGLVSPSLATAELRNVHVHPIVH